MCPYYELKQVIKSICPFIAISFYIQSQKKFIINSLASPVTQGQGQVTMAVWNYITIILNIENHSKMSNGSPDILKSPRANNFGMGIIFRWYVEVIISYYYYNSCYIFPYKDGYELYGESSEPTLWPNTCWVSFTYASRTAVYYWPTVPVYSPISFFILLWGRYIYHSASSFYCGVGPSRNRLLPFIVG